MSEMRASAHVATAPVERSHERAGFGVTGPDAQQARDYNQEWRRYEECKLRREQNRQRFICGQPPLLPTMPLWKIHELKDHDEHGG